MTYIAHFPVDALNDPIERETIIAKIGSRELTHIHTRSGDIHEIRPWVNKKSIPINDPSQGISQRVTLGQIISIGTTTEDAKRELDDAMTDGKDLGATVQVQKTPAVAVPNNQRVTRVIEQAAQETGILKPQHADREHALLSASGAHRWLNCPPSAKLEDLYPDSTSDAAEEGTAAHELAEHKLRQLMGLASTRPESRWHNEDMDSHTDDYTDCVLAELEQAKQTSPAAFLAIEQRLDLSHIVPDSFGTGDALIVGDGRMTIVDLKYGKGVEVSAVNNPQMRLYALGALTKFSMIYNIEQVRMVIFQPRLGNISIDEISVQELTAWGENVVKPVAELATAGEGKLTAGDWCRFCRHSAQCPAQAALYMEPITPMLDNPEPPAPDTLSAEQIAQIVSVAGDIKKWLTAVEKHALDQANTGKHYPGLKLVEGRSVRKYTDEQAVATVVEGLGHDPWERKILGVTAMTKLLGKKQFDAALHGLLHKPEGKPTLVPESDKRQELTVATPETVFQPIKETT